MERTSPRPPTPKTHIHPVWPQTQSCANFAPCLSSLAGSHSLRDWGGLDCSVSFPPGSQGNNGGLEKVNNQ